MAISGWWLLDADYPKCTGLGRIQITCRGADILPIDSLTPFQGRLKKLSDTAFEKLKQSILKYGISFPLFVWRHEGLIFTLDGHQRDVVLKKMREEGYEVPPVPVDFIEATDRKEAKQKILLLSSQYGKPTAASVKRFAEESEIDLEEMAELVDLPGIDLDQMIEHEEEQPEVEFSEELLLEHKYLVLYFDNPMDWQVAMEKFDLKKVRDLIPRKGQPIGIGRVIHGGPWLERIK